MALLLSQNWSHNEMALGGYYQDLRVPQVVKTVTHLPSASLLKLPAMGRCQVADAASSLLRSICSFLKDADLAPAYLVGTEAAKLKSVQ